ncbi:hypothetical protein OIU34_18245 [Pararhizobium sp. BT-229]|uniref:hypothetical protein n=1 Tax=Pararhizobium sp. BT-229 TaxID=2986923 RepID=UPI0021F7B1F8|nr:hypothetical protein [Pararhizobium sp. BT-229]MCV9963821.1 hypothetical protein [Pararhizobium sp. BT-229]
MDTKTERRRDAFIAGEVGRAAAEVAKLRNEGRDVCDIAYIEGSMIEAGKLFDRINSKT